jgi:hypothetical protein
MKLFKRKKESTMNNKNIEFRFINWSNIYILCKDLPAVEALLQQAAWTAMPTTINDVVTLVAPKTSPYVATDNYDVIRAFAPYVIIPGGHLILERTDTTSYQKDWLHIVFSGKSDFWEEITPAGQWQCQQIRGVL